VKRVEFIKKGDHHGPKSKSEKEIGMPKKAKKAGLKRVAGS